MDSQIWLNVLVNDHQFGYIHRIEKEKENSEQYVTSHLFFRCSFSFSFLLKKKKQKIFSFFLLVLYRCPIPPLQQLPLRFQFHLLPLVEEGGKTPQVATKTRNTLSRRFCTTTSTGLVLQQRH